MTLSHSLLAVLLLLHISSYLLSYVLNTYIFYQQMYHGYEVFWV